MRVLCVVGEFPKLSETFVASFHEALRDAGHEVRVLAARRGPDFSTDSRVHFLGRWKDLRPSWPVLAPGGGSLGVRAWCAGASVSAKRHLGLWRPDVVHSHFLDSPAVLALAVARRLGVPVTSHAHAADWSKHTSTATLRERIKLLDGVFGVSQATVAGIRNKVGHDHAPPEKFRVVRAFGASADEVIRPGQEHERFVATACRLVKKKGVDLLIRAVPRFPEDVSLVIVGEGPERQALQGLAAELGLEGRVRFLGAQPNEAVRAVLAGSVCVALPCRQLDDGDVDGIPVVLMEAMGLGVPVVSVAVGGISELISDNSSGLLVPQNDSESLARAVLHLASNPADRRRLAQNGQAVLQGEFKPELQIERAMGAWRALIS